VRLIHPIAETAYAKINLTLRVLGRRTDGQHELHSLVVFADLGDSLVVTPRIDGSPPRPSTLIVEGPFAGEIAGENLVERAMRAVEHASGVPFDADVVLDKRLPVASGIGGGSADAAAMLRAMRKAGGAAHSSVDWLEIARRLGADVPVCLGSRSAIMTGAGEKLATIVLPRLDIVLVNARQPVPVDKTRQVFQALAAAPLPPSPSSEGVPKLCFDRASLLDTMRLDGNDLERAATTILPSIAEVKAAVAATAGCEIAALSGAGPTIVGVFASAQAAAWAARSLADIHPDWWVAAGTTLVA
jgi:4-diphosphocytidyl-2-C-methyl-D-erythritol kinase